MSSLQEVIAKGVVEAFKLLSDEDIQRLIIAPYLELQDESKEQAKLEAEALALFNAYRWAMDSPPVAYWHQFPSDVKDYWLAVARKAREIGGRADK